MNTLLWIVIITFVAGVVGTGLGGVVASVFKKNSEKTVSLMLSFAAGVMLSVVCFDLITSALNNGGEGVTRQNLILVILGVLVGYGVVFFLNYIIDKNTNHEVKHIDKNHPQTADSAAELIHSDHLEAHRENNGSLFVAGVVMALAIALHNIPEGMVIGASYVNSNSSLFTGSAFILALVIALHNIPEGMAVSVPLIAGGMSKPKAILTTALSGAPTILGAVLGYLVGALNETSLTISLSFASGAMLYVVLGELMPEAILYCKSKLPAFVMLVGIIVGLIVIYF